MNSLFQRVACRSSAWGMPASGNSVPSDGDREQVVEIQGDHCRTPTGSAPYDLRAVLAQVEMPGPLLTAGIIELDAAIYSISSVQGK
jgi:hypothetical protein